MADALVNAIDYLESGIFAQKKFKDGQSVASRAGCSLVSLAVADVSAEITPAQSDVARGYEMTDVPLSLPMDAASLNAFEEMLFLRWRRGKTFVCFV